MPRRATVRQAPASTAARTGQPVRDRAQVPDIDLGPDVKPGAADLIEQSQAEAGRYKGNPKNTEEGKKDRIPDVPWDMNFTDEQTEDALMASLKGGGPKTVDLTPQRPPETPPSSLSEMWGRFTEFRARVEAYIAAGGQVQASAGHPVPTLFRCAAHTRRPVGDDPGEKGVVEVMWPAGPEGAKCPVCNDLTLLIPLTPEEISEYRAGEKVAV